MISWRDIEEKMRYKFDPWQIEFIEATDQRLLLCNGRKTGKTTAIASKVALEMMNATFGESHGICIIGNGLKGAKDILFTVRAILQSFGYEFGRDMNNIDEAYGTVLTLRLPNGNQCVAHPAGNTGDAIRPYSFHWLIIDEAAYVNDAVDVAINACLMIHGKMEIRSSTPAGNSGSFYNAYHSALYRTWHVRTDQIQHHRPETIKFLNIEKKRLTRVEFDQEYNAEFTETADGIYPRQLIAACTGRGVDWKLIEKRATSVFVGVDFAKFGDDKNVIALNYFDGECSYIKVIPIESKVRTTAIVGRLMNIYKNEPRVKLIITDEGGLGEGPTDQLIEMIGKRKIIGIKNQKLYEKRFMKVHLHNNLIRMMENGRVVFEDDVEIVRSLRSVHYKYGMSGKLSIGGRNTHAAEAMVRAVFPLMQRRYNRPDNYFLSVPHERDPTVSFIENENHYIIGG